MQKQNSSATYLALHCITSNGKCNPPLTICRSLVIGQCQGFHLHHEFLT